MKNLFAFALVFTAIFFQPAAAQGLSPTPSPSPVPAVENILDAGELLQIVNQARVQVGHRPLVLDPILMSYSQSSADLAANSILAQSNGVTADVIAMGYGYPETSETIFCTSSFNKLSLDTSDPATVVGFGSLGENAVTNAFYRHVGFGIAKGVGDWEGYVFYHLNACYTADNRYNPGQKVTPGAFTPQVMPQVIYAVQTAQPQSDGRLFHEVRSGQSLWAIAVAYNTHIADILRLNNLPPEFNTIYQGQMLLIPTPQGGYLTPQGGYPTPQGGYLTPPGGYLTPPGGLPVSTTPPEAPTPAPPAPGETIQLDTHTPAPSPNISNTAGSSAGKISSDAAILGVLVAGGLALLIVSMIKQH